MSELALRHNDDAVLERHHAHTTFELLLRDPDSALFESLNKQDLRQVRKAILEGILATDMSKHVRMCEVLVGKINKGASSSTAARRVTVAWCYAHVVCCTPQNAVSPPCTRSVMHCLRRRRSPLASGTCIRGWCVCCTSLALTPCYVSCRRRRKGDDRGFSSMPPPPFNKESAQDRLCLIEALVHTYVAWACGCLHSGC